MFGALKRGFRSMAGLILVRNVVLLANFDRKEHLQHRAVSLRQHGFLVINTEPPNSQRNFTWGEGIRLSSVYQFRGLFTKICVSKCCKKRRAYQQLNSMHTLGLFSVLCMKFDRRFVYHTAYWKDDNVIITSKLTWKLKHGNSILSFEYFCPI